MLQDILLFYAVGSVIVGLFVSSMDKVSITLPSGRSTPFPRLVAGIFAGAIWPWTLWKLVVGR